ncbi:N-methyl-L-tryptophan oxidase [soil metagenome]
MTTHNTDVVVIGGGAMGTAAGWALARRGARVVVLEQFQHVHNFGSHGGRTRIFRHAYAEGGRYVPWAIEADALWSDLQQRTGAKFMHRIGCVDISGPGFHRAREARASAEQHGLASEWLTGADVNDRWPIWNVPDDREVCFGAEAGFLDVAKALTSLAGEMNEAGGVLHERTPVLSWSATDSGVRVTTANDTFEAQKLIVTAGSWSGHLLAELGIPLEVLRKPVLWFEVDDRRRALSGPDAMPVFISDDELGEFYGIPNFEGHGVKVGMHSGRDVVDPDTVDRTVSDADIRTDILPFIERSFHGFTGNIVDSSVCLYTMTPDADFAIDRHPEHDQVVFATGFSGHGFKFTPVVGQYLAALASDDTARVIEDFAINRFAAMSHL